MQRLGADDPAALAAAASRGDQDALAIWDRYGELLGTGISSLVYLFTPQLVLLGGGLAGASVHFLPAVRREVTSRVQAISREGLQIKACALGNGAGRLVRLAWRFSVCFRLRHPRRDDGASSLIHARAGRSRTLPGASVAGGWIASGRD